MTEGNALSTIVHRAVIEFIESLKAGHRIAIEAVLEQIPPIERPTLAKELVAAEWNWRSSHGEHPSETDYSSRFPMLAAELRQLAEPHLVAETPTHIGMNDSASNYPPIGETLDGGARTNVSTKTGDAHFGDYLLVGEIARGGMGVVHRARDLRLNRTVALKMILGGRVVSAECIQRFHSEAQAAARLEHSGIVPIYEIGQEGDQHFFTMAYIDGGSLAQRVKSGPLPPDEAARLVKEIAVAVHYAHAHGVIHRDLKPQNILLDGDGHPKVTDFGLAKITDDDAGLSTTGDVMGTPSYMAPEQATGQVHTVGPLADVYSIGAILYCLLTGRPPFQAASILETLRQVKEVDAVSMRVLNPAVPRDLDTIAMKCLQKSPAKRYASARLLAEDVERFLEGRNILARPTGVVERTWRWCRRNPLATGIIALCLTLVLFAGVLLDYRNRLASADAAQHAAEEVADAQTYFALVNKVREASSTPRPGWTWTAFDNLKAAAAIPTKLRDDLDLRNLSMQTLMQVDLRELTVLDPGDGAQLKGIAFDPAGRRLAVGKLKGGLNLEVFVYDTETLQRVQLLSQSTVADSLSKLMSLNKRYQDGVRSVAWSPDGKLLAVGTRQGTIFVWNTAAADTKPVSWRAHESDVESMAFSADGRTLFSNHKDLKQWNVHDNWKSVPTSSGQVHHFAVHPGGRFVALNDAAHLKLGVVDRQETLQHWPDRHLVGRVAYSPDGRLLAVESADGLKILDARVGNELATLRDDTTNARLAVYHVSFAANGTLLVTLDDDRRLRLWDIAAGHLLLRTRAIAAEEPQVAVSDSANRLAVVSGSQLIVYETRFGSPSQIVAVQPNEIAGLDATADGTTVATLSDGPLPTPPGARLWQTSVWDSKVNRLNDIDAIVATVRPTPPGDETNSVAFGSTPGNVFVATPPFGLSSMTSSSELKYAQIPGVGTVVTVGLSDLATEGRTEMGSIDSSAASHQSLRLVANAGSHAAVRFELTPERVRSWPGDRWMILARVRCSEAAWVDAILETSATAAERNVSHSITGALLPTNGFCQVTLGMISRGDVKSGKPCSVSLKLRSTGSAEIAVWLDQCLAIPYRDMPGGHVAKHEVEFLSLGPDGAHLSGIVEDKLQICTWDTTNLAVTGLHDQAKALTAVTTGMSSIYSLDTGRTLTVAGLRTGNVLFVPHDKSVTTREAAMPGSEPISAIALTRDESHCAVGTLSGRVFWIDRRGRVLADWMAHPERIAALALADNGDRLVTASSDRTIRVWQRDGDRFREFVTIATGSRPPIALRLRENGKRLFFLNEGERAVHSIDFEAARRELHAIGIR